MPFIFGMLCVIGFGLSALVIFLIIKKSEKQTIITTFIAIFLLPTACIIGSVLFNLALPHAGKTVHWLNARDIIRATNGPSAVVFEYVVSPGTPIMLPRYFEMTAQHPEDILRCHVASLYLSDSKEAYFVAEQYPDIYNRLVDQEDKE